MNYYLLFVMKLLANTGSSCFYHLTLSERWRTPSVGSLFSSGIAKGFTSKIQ